MKEAVRFLLKILIGICMGSFLSSALSFPCFATETEGPSIIIRIREKGTGNSIKKAEVKVGEKIFYTDSDGKLELPGPDEMREFRVSRNGYEDRLVTLDLSQGTREFDVFLEPKIENDNVVVVRGVKRKEASKKLVTATEAAKVSPGGDPAKVTQLLPGVQTRGFGTQVAIRGSAPEDSIYLIDDLKVPYVFHTIGGVSVLSEEMIEDVEFSSGGFGTRYGDATGGTVVLRTPAQPQSEKKTVVKVNVPIYSGIYQQTPLSDSSSVTAYARRSYLDAFVDAIVKKRSKGETQSTVVPIFADGGSIYQRRSESISDKVTGLYVYDGLTLVTPADFSSNENGTANVSVDNRYGVLGWQHGRSLGSGWSYTVTPQVAVLKNRQDFLGNKLDLDTENYSVPMEFSSRISDSRRLFLGVEPQYGRAKVAAILPVFDEQDPFFDFESAEIIKTNHRVEFSSEAAWIEYEIGGGRDSWMWRPGLRFNHNGYLKKQNADPRINIQIPLGQKNTLKFAGGIYSKTPEPRFITKDYGNPDLDFVYSTHLVAGVETDWDETWTSDLQFYGKKGHNEVTSDPELKYDNNGSSRSVGFELFIRHRPTSRLFGWLSYTYSKTEQRSSDTEKFHASQFDQRQVANLVGNYRITRDWESGGRFEYHSGDTYSPAENVVYNASSDRYSPRTNSSQSGARRLPAFHRFDIFAGRDALYNTWKMNTRFGVQFLSLRSQIYGLNYNYDYTKEVPVTGIPPIPYLEVSATL